MKSAFFFHGLTDMIPDECDLATTRDAAKIKDKKYFVPDDFFKEGIETADYKGYNIQIHFFKVVEIVGTLWIDAFMYAEKLSVFFGGKGTATVGAGKAERCCDKFTRAESLTTDLANKEHEKLYYEKLEQARY